MADNEDYEAIRLRNILENQKLLASLGVQPNGIKGEEGDEDENEELLREERRLARAESKARLTAERREGDRRRTSRATAFVKKEAVNAEPAAPVRISRETRYRNRHGLGLPLPIDIIAHIISLALAPLSSTSVSLLILNKKLHSLALPLFYSHISITSNRSLLKVFGLNTGLFENVGSIAGGNTMKKGKKPILLANSTRKRLALPLELIDDSRQAWIERMEGKLQFVKTITFAERFTTNFQLTEATSLINNVEPLNILPLLPSLEHITMHYITHQTYLPIMQLYTHLFNAPSFAPVHGVHVGLDVIPPQNPLHVNRICDASLGETFINRATSIEFISIFDAVQYCLNLIATSSSPAAAAAGIASAGEVEEEAAEETLVEKILSSPTPPTIPAEFTKPLITSLDITHVPLILTKPGTLDPMDTRLLELLPLFYPSLKRIAVKYIRVQHAPRKDPKFLVEVARDGDGGFMWRDAMRQWISVAGSVGGMVTFEDDVEAGQILTDVLERLK